MEQNTLSMELEILYLDEYFCAINKPAGLMVHKSRVARDVKTFAMQELRNQLDRYVYPVHRLDRATSGILLFALSPEDCTLAQQMITDRKITKKYWTVLRGYTPEEGEIDKALTSEFNDTPKESLTIYKKLEQQESPFKVSERYPACRTSLVEAQPITGRTHQLRQHFAKIRHYIIGDNKHGDHKLNKGFKSEVGVENMLLHARSLTFIHPHSGENVHIEAPLPDYYSEILDKLGYQYHQQ
ncbi:pseudouridine synthase [Persicobacter diffluens]|uniref:tRNA pseudouridine synthase C n=1 Tax=Persicobacter diffluens TaxID=981 RepID=A0AAN5AJI0_9BACT|nr:tRNA pseudouridine synthase C [Persicobacter diffluens]